MKLTKILSSALFKYSTLIVFLISILFLYLYKNNTTPVSLFSDESDINYQAFVFNKYHTDYFGNKFPIHFHSFADYQPSLYIYSVALTQKIVGHTDASIRIPAAIYAVLAIFIFYLILNHILNNHYWAVFGSFILSTTPWLFHFSRSGFAVTNMLFLTLLGIYFWIKYLSSQKNILLYFSLASFSLLTYSYSTAKLHLILLFLTAFFVWFKEILAIPTKTKIISFFLILLITFPIIIDILKGNAGYRFAYINIFSDPTVSKTVDFMRQEDSSMIYGQEIGLKPSLMSKIFYNKVSIWIGMFTKNYLSSFSTEFLFIKGDGNLRQGVQTVGNLLLPDFIFIFIGLISIFTIKNFKHNKFIIFSLISLFLAPIPFALTRDSAFPHSTRLILMLPFLVIISIFGIIKINQIFKSKFILLIIFMAYMFNFSSFLHQYYFHYPNISARDWHYGMKEAVLKSYNSDFEKIYYINSYEPFMPFFLNYSEYISKNNIPAAKTLLWDNNHYFTGMQTDNKYYLGNIEWSILFSDKKNISNKYLYVIPQKEKVRIDDSLKVHSDINLNVIDQVTKKYTEQETFYLINFEYENN